MHRAAWTIGLVVALVTAALAGAQLSQTSSTADAAGEDAVVMAAPHEGDRATYRTTHTDATSSDTDEPRTIHRSWNRSSVRLPDGTERSFPTLATWQPPQVEREDAEAEDDRTIAVVPLLDVPDLGPRRSQAAAEVHRSHWTHNAHFTRLPGDEAVASSFGSFSTEDDEASSTYRFRSVRVADAGGCTGPTAGRLAGATAAEARDAIRSCLDARLDAIGNATADLSTRWTQREPFGRVWEATIQASYQPPDGDEVTVDTTIVTSPERSLPVLEVSRHDTGGEADPRASTSRTEMVDWHPGGDALPSAVDPLPQMPTVPLVGWTPRGPEQGQLEAFSLSEAREAIERTREGRSFFQDADQARVSQAAFVDQDRHLRLDTSRSSVNGVRCQPHGSTVSVQAPEPMGTRSWDVEWVSPDSGSLSGHARTPRVAQDNPSGQDLPLAQAEAYRYEDEGEEPWGSYGQPPAQTGPAPGVLWAKRDLAGALQENGTYVVGVHQDFVVDLADGDEPRSLVGFVGRVDCEQTAEGHGHQAFSTRVTFDHGQALHVEQTFERWTWDDGSQQPSTIR